MEGRYPPNTPSHSAPQYTERPNVPGQQRMHFEAPGPNPPFAQQRDPYMNQQSRPQLTRGHGTYSGTPNHPSPQLYPAHMQSLAPKSFPGHSPDYGSNTRLPQHQAPHLNRVATLPNPLPQSHPTYPSYPQELSPQLPSYPGPPPFEFIPNHNNTQSFLGPGNASGYQEVHGHVHPQFSPPVPNPLTVQSPDYAGTQDIVTSPTSPDDEAEIALAIALSEKMVIVEQEREEQLRKQEEAEFQKVLALSMLDTNDLRGGSSSPAFDTDPIATSSQVKLESPIWDGASHNQGSPQATDTPTQATSSQQVNGHGPRNRRPTLETNGSSTSVQGRWIVGEEPVRVEESSEGRPGSFQEEPEKIFRDERSPLSNFVAPGPPGERSPSPLHITIGQDNALDPDDVVVTLAPTGITRQVTRVSRRNGPVLTGTPQSESPTELAYHDELPAPLNTTVRTPPGHGLPPSTAPSYNPSHHRLHSVDKNFSPSHATMPIPSNTQALYDDKKEAISAGSSDTLVSKSSYQTMPMPQVNERATLPPGAAQPVTLVPNSNQYIDPDLLLGVTIDFKPPVLLAQLRPMPMAIPNIVSLPFGRVHPLHIQAPSWKHLLKLLARMGNSKFEPTLQAQAHARAQGIELKLRTVIQFVRIHPNTDDWRTILWFTIDHPVPPALPNAAKYRNPNTDVLPWSYELMDYPILLRNAADSAMSKTYTIPATESLPYPSLPMTFPNLALYLQAALDFSRQQKDDTNGYRKLSKMIQSCYPMDEIAGESSEKTTVGGLFKRVIKRGNNKKKTGKTNNEETYEYITPFVPDEWG